jgi:hypothetical protein
VARPREAVGCWTLIRRKVGSGQLNDRRLHARVDCKIAALRPALHETVAANSCYRAVLMWGAMSGNATKTTLMWVAARWAEVTSYRFRRSGDHAGREAL